MKPDFSPIPFANINIILLITNILREKKYKMLIFLCKKNQIFFCVRTLPK